MQCCPLSPSDEPAAKVYTATVVKAAKEHSCYECKNTISRGTRYECVKGLWDGTWNSFKTCLPCRDIRDHFSCGGFSFGALWEELEINFFPGMKAGGPCMDGLSPEGKSKLFEERTRWIFESDEYQPEGFALPPNVIRTSEKPEAAPVILLSFTFVESLGFRPGDIVDGNDLYVVSIYTAYNLLIRVINRNVLLVCLPDNLSSMELTGSIRQFGDPEMGWQTVSREEREELISLLRKSTHPQATLIVQKLTEL